MSTFYHSVELVIWLWIRPSMWRRHLRGIDEKIPNNFALIDLHWSQWCNSRLRNTLLAGYLCIPALVLIITLPVVAAISGEVAGSITGYMFVYLIGLCIGIYISVPASILYLVIAGVAVLVHWMGGQILIFDFTSGLSAGVLFGCCAACVIIAAINHGDTRSNRSVMHQIGAIILGLLISIPLVVAVTYSVVVTTAGRQSGALHGGWIIWTLILPPLIVSVLTVYVRTGSILKIVVPALFCLAMFSTGFGDMGYEYDRSVGGFTLLSANITVIISTFCMLSFFSNVLVRPFVGDLPAGVTSAVGGLMIYFGLHASFTYFPLLQNLAVSIAIILSALFFRHVWSIFSYPFQAAWNRVLVELDLKQAGPHRYLSRHSVCWDEIQYLPFFELDDYLISSAGKNGDSGESYLKTVNQSNQQWAAQSALIELDARRLEALPDIKAIANTHSDHSAGLLSTTAGLILRSFSQLSQDVDAALAQPSCFNQVLVLRTVSNELEQLQLELNRNYKDRTAIRFTKVAEQWHRVVSQYSNVLDQKSKINKEIPNPYTVGAPLTRRQEIFVGRTDIARFLEGILVQQDHPPLLLYGPRRMGKTSLLYQLHWMLPRHILTLIVDFQGPVGLAQDHSGFVFALSRGMSRAAARSNIELTTLSRSAFTEDPFIRFDEWLNTIESEMLCQGCSTLLLALDEFEVLDTALREGTLQAHAVLGMLRHISQHRSRIKLMLVGSHTLGEFRRWASYFVNAQVVELSYLSRAEACQLIEQPISEYPLKFQSGASERIFQFSRGHPYLVQLACAELVALKNTHCFEQRHQATVKDIETCIPLTLQRGQQFFTDIELNQVSELGRTCLKQLATFGDDGAEVSSLEELIPALKNSDTLFELEQRSIIERTSDRYYFQIEAVALWFNTDRSI